MGFNALRRYRGGRAVDLAILIVVPLIVLALVLWVFTG